MVEWRTRERDMRGDGINHDEKLGLQRIPCASQFTITDMAGSSSNQACNYIGRGSSQPNQASRTPDFSYLLVSSTWFSSSSPSLSFSFTTLPSSQNTKLSHPSLSLHAMIMSWHSVQHTLSTASTQDCLSSLYSHHYELTPECSFSFWRASLHDRLPSASFPYELKGKVTLSRSHSFKFTNWWIESQHPARRPSTAYNYLSKLTRSRPPSASPNSPNHGLEVYIQTRSITACKFAQSWPPGASPNSLDHDLAVHL